MRTFLPLALALAWHWGADEVARWLADSVPLPQYSHEQAFREDPAPPPAGRACVTVCGEEI